jgi:hypothetical protein
MISTRAIQIDFRKLKTSEFDKQKTTPSQATLRPSNIAGYRRAKLSALQALTLAS